MTPERINQIINKRTKLHFHFTSSLDGMNLAELMLPDGLRHRYVRELVEVARRLKPGETRSAESSHFVVINAKAELRAEAFVRTYDMWEDGK